MTLLRLLPLLVLGGAACSGPRPDRVPPEQRYGAELPDDPDVETLRIVPPDSLQEYLTAPAYIEAIIVRPAPFLTPADTVEGVPLEVLIKGTLPDACAELSNVTQARAARYVDLTLTMRRPRGAFCAAVVRPYRFFITLDGRFRPGAHVLTVNGTQRPFEIDAPDLP